MKDDRERIEVFTNELPTLKLEKTRTIGDFEVERVALHASGSSVEQAMRGIKYLLDISDHNVNERRG